MNNLKYKVVSTKKMKHQLKLIRKRSKNMGKMDTVVRILASGQRLPAKYQDHNLVDDKNTKIVANVILNPIGYWSIVLKTMN